MSERENSEGVVLADPDSLLGMLQRGRGRGYLMALETPAEEVWPLLFECVTNDPRVERHLEPRDDYYASLILKTGMDLEALWSFVKQNDDDAGKADLAFQTLESLAHHGSRRAMEFLCEYIRHGCDFESIKFIVDDLAALRAMEGIAEILYRRINDHPENYAEFKKEVEEDWTCYCQEDEDTRRRGRFLLPMCEPWKSLCGSNSGFADLFARVGLPYDRPPAVHKVTNADVAALSIGELLSSVNRESFYPSRRALIQKVSVEDEDRLLDGLSSENERRVMLAFCGLGKLGTPKAFEAVKAYIEGSENANWMVRGKAFDAFENMPSLLTLETARQWFSRDEWHLRAAAGHVLERHAILEDVPKLIQALRCGDSRLIFALHALARFQGFGRIPELEQIFCQEGDCYYRGYAAEAMAKTAPAHFTTEYAFECLWDCDWGAFKTGCAMVNLSTPGAIERLEEIAGDPGECEDTRQAARQRLETNG